MTIEIKVTGADATETVQQFLGLAGYFGATPVSVAPVLTADESDDAPDSAPSGVDKEGIPFDARIHSSAANPFKADGTWKRRKNVSDDEYNRIYAELKAKVTATIVVPQPAAPLVVADTPLETAAPAPAAETIAPPPAPAAETAPPPAPTVAPTTGKTHAELQGALTSVLTRINTTLPGKATPILLGLMASYGVQSVAQIPADKVDDCYNKMQRMAADPANAEAIAAGLM